MNDLTLLVTSINESTEDTWLIDVCVDGISETLEWLFDADETIESISASFDAYFGDDWQSELKILSYKPIHKNNYFFRG